MEGNAAMWVKNIEEIRDYETLGSLKKYFFQQKKLGIFADHLINHSVLEGRNPE